MSALLYVYYTPILYYLYYTIPILYIFHLFSYCEKGGCYMWNFPYTRPLSSSPNYIRCLPSG